MKFYNPFKPHIVEFSNGRFAVRRYEFLAWTYHARNFPVQTDRQWWYLHEYIIKYCMVDTLEEAKSILKNSTLKVKTVHEA